MCSSDLLQTLSGAPTLLNMESQDLDGSQETEYLGADAHDEELMPPGEDDSAYYAAAILSRPTKGETPNGKDRETPASPTSNTLVSTATNSNYGDCPAAGAAEKSKSTTKTPSANRLSISYAGGNRRLVIDAEVVDALKLFRHEGRIEVSIKVDKEREDGLKGIQVWLSSGHNNAHTDFSD